MGQAVFLKRSTLGEGTDWLFRVIVTNYQSTLRNIQEARRWRQKTEITHIFHELYMGF
jgi:hypothetical protein